MRTQPSTETEGKGQGVLLMQIVVKQDQIEVQLQAPQRPLLDRMLTTTFLLQPLWPKTFQLPLVFEELFLQVM